MSEKKVTLADIAKAAGMSKTAVSYALRDDPNIRRETRLRIQEVARQLGYRPDPLLAKLMSHLHEGSAKRYAGEIAYLDLLDVPHISAFPTLDAFQSGAARRAETLGYKLTPFHYKEPGISPKRLAQILVSRGIQGVLVGSTTHSDSSIEFPWEHFAAITVGYSVARPLLHRVVTHHYRNTRLAIRKVRDAGCRRLGFVINHLHDAYMEDLHRAAVATYQEALPEAERVPCLVLEDLEERSIHSIRGWYERHSPDVILCAGLSLGHLRDAGIRVPDEVPAVDLLISYETPEVAGISLRYDLLGVMAVNLLVAQLHHDEFGLPEVPQIVQTEGVWHEGKSFPSGSAARLE